MDCCCRPEQVIKREDQKSNRSQQKLSSRIKYSFRTQQADVNQKLTYDRSQIPRTQVYNPAFQQKVGGYGLGSTVASRDQMIELQRQRQSLLQQDNNLNLFYQNAIVPLEREVEYYEKEVKIRSIQIMELQDLLNQKIKERNQQYVYSQPLPMSFVPGFNGPVFANPVVSEANGMVRPYRVAM